MTTPPPPGPSALPQHRPTRRTVARGAAWSVPVVVVGAAAPVAAASPCPPVEYTIDWLDTGSATYTRTTKYESFALVLPPSPSDPTVRVDFSAALTGEMELTDLNLTVSGAGVGGLSPAQRGLVLSQRLTTAAGATPPQRAARQQLTVSFSDATTSAPLTVTGVTFTITDIDSATVVPNDFIDRVEVVPDPVVTNAAAVTGAGTAASPLAPTDGNTPQDDTTSSLGNSRVTIDGPVSGSIALTYWNAATRTLRPPDDAIQQVYLANITFTVVSDAC